MILVEVQNWDILKKLVKLWSFPESFHNNMSHEQILFTWSIFRDSSIGTKLEYIWKTDENVKSVRICFQKHVSRTITFNVIHNLWF